MNSHRSAERERTVRRVLTVVLVAWGLVGLAGLVWGAGNWLRSRPSLEGAIALVDAGRLDEAESRLRARLSDDPDDGAAHLLLAQLAVKRLDSPTTLAGRPPEEWAGRALDHLGRVHPSDPRSAVMFQVCRGRALHRLLRLAEAEAAWLEALRISPTAPEAGWHLLELYYVQGRREEARRLALRLHEAEPDPHDRARLLVELLRADARPPAPGSVVSLLEPVVQQHPDDLHSAIALGLALTRIGRVDEGGDRLRRAARSHPDRLEAWDALLTGLDESGRIDRMAEELDRVPPAVAGSPRLARHRARVAQERRRWAEAATLARVALAAEPEQRAVAYRLARILRYTGEAAEAERLDQLVRRFDEALKDVRPLYDRASGDPGLGLRPDPDLYRQIADACERMRRPGEARAWHRLVLAADPRDEASRAALARLGNP